MQFYGQMYPTRELAFDRSFKRKVRGIAKHVPMGLYEWGVANLKPGEAAKGIQSTPRHGRGLYFLHFNVFKDENGEVEAYFEDHHEQYWIVNREQIYQAIGFRPTERRGLDLEQDHLVQLLHVPCVTGDVVYWHRAWRRVVERAYQMGEMPAGPHRFYDLLHKKLNYIHMARMDDGQLLNIEDVEELERAANEQCEMRFNQAGYGEARYISHAEQRFWRRAEAWMDRPQTLGKWTDFRDFVLNDN